MPSTEHWVRPHFDRASALARDFCRTLGAKYDDDEWLVLAYARNLSIIGVWLVILGGATLAAPLFGGTLVLAFIWKARHASRWDKELRALAKRRRSFPIAIRKKLYRDGIRFVFWDYWRIIDIPELRELRKAYRTDQFIGLLLVALDPLGEFFEHRRVVPERRNVALTGLCRELSFLRRQFPRFGSREMAKGA